jgi:hypothetical protein
MRPNCADWVLGVLNGQSRPIPLRWIRQGRRSTFHSQPNAIPRQPKRSLARATDIRQSLMLREMRSAWRTLGRIETLSMIWVGQALDPVVLI